MWYNVNFYKLCFDFMLVSLRKPIELAVLYAYTKPLVTLQIKWLNYRRENLYILDHTGQICRLRGALNDKFDNELRRIYIDGDGGAAERTYIYTPAENQTKYLGKLYLYNALEFGDNGADFIVYVPSEIMETQNFEVRAQIDLYRAGGKRYLIIQI